MINIFTIIFSTVFRFIFDCLSLLDNVVFPTHFGPISYLSIIISGLIVSFFISLFAKVGGNN